MILGIGTDVLELRRIEKSLVRFGQNFIFRIFSEAEQELIRESFGLWTKPSSRLIAYVGARFAAKEAAVKALGTGFSQGIGFKDIAIHKDSAGKPLLYLFGQAEAKAKALGAVNLHLSLSHSLENAVAMVILESN